MGKVIDQRPEARSEDDGKFAVCPCGVRFWRRVTGEVPRSLVSHMYGHLRPEERARVLADLRAVVQACMDEIDRDLAVTS